MDRDPLPLSPCRCLWLHARGFWRFRVRRWGTWYLAVAILTLLWALAIAVLILSMCGPCLAEEYRTFRVTAFCPCARCCGKHADGITASGTRADHPLVAAPRSFPFGTLMQIPGYAEGRWVRVEDRGGAIKGNRLDVLFPTHKAALAWGVKMLKVRVRAKGGSDEQ